MTDLQARALQMKLLGALLREARMAAGKSLKTAARLVGISATTLASYETGRKAMSLPELELFCLRLNVPIRRFWETRPASPPHPPDVDPGGLLPGLHRRIGAQLRAHRQAARLSVRKVSDKVGIPASRISSYERGERGVPLPDLLALAKALEHTVEEYLERNGAVGEWDTAERLSRTLAGLPPDLRTFLSQPANLPYLLLARRLSELPADRLRSVAEDLRSLTP